MARNQTRVKSVEKLRGEDKTNRKRIKVNGNIRNLVTRSSDDGDEAEVLVVPSSSCESHHEGSEEADEEIGNGDSDEEDEELEEVEEEAKNVDTLKKKSNKKEETKKHKKNGVEKKNKKKRQMKDEKDEENGLHRFPMNRISRIIRSENSDIRISQEAVFLINKASEKFVELFCKEAYACAFLDRKSYVAYSHLSSVVSKRKRFDFISDFVPKKVKAEDALAQFSSTER